MRENNPGLIAWALLMAGIAAGGVWIVTLAGDGGAPSWPWGAAAAACLTGGLTMLAVLRHRWGTDPLEPAVPYHAVDRLRADRARVRRDRSGWRVVDGVVLGVAEHAGRGGGAR